MSRRTAQRLTLKQQRARSKPTMKLCDGCGKVEESQGRTWCDCNPGAPFEMVDVEIRDLTNRTIAKMFNLKK